MTAPPIEQTVAFEPGTEYYPRYYRAPDATRQSLEPPVSHHDQTIVDREGIAFATTAVMAPVVLELETTDTHPNDYYGTLMEKRDLPELDAELDPSYGDPKTNGDAWVSKAELYDNDRKVHAIAVDGIAQASRYEPLSISADDPHATEQLIAMSRRLVTGYRKFREGLFLHPSTTPEESRLVSLEDRARQALLEDSARRLGQALFGARGKLATQEVLDAIQERTGLPFGHTTVGMRLPIRPEFAPVTAEYSGSYLMSPDEIHGYKVINTDNNGQYFVVATPFGRRRVPVVNPHTN